MTQPCEIMTELREIRKQKRISQDAMSMLLGQSGNNGYVSHLENGRHAPLISTVVTWADALGYELVLRPKT